MTIRKPNFRALEKLEVEAVIRRQSQTNQMSPQQAHDELMQIIEDLEAENAARIDKLKSELTPADFDALMELERQEAEAEEARIRAIPLKEEWLGWRFNTEGIDDPTGDIARALIFHWLDMAQDAVKRDEETVFQDPETYQDTAERMGISS